MVENFELFHFIRNNVSYYIRNKFFIRRLLNNVKKYIFFSMSEYDQAPLGYRDSENLYQLNGAKKKKKKLNGYTCRTTTSPKLPGKNLKNYFKASGFSIIQEFRQTKVKKTL